MTAPLAPLIATPQWIVVLLVPLENGKMDKVPSDYRSGGPYVDAHDPQYWTDHATALRCAQAWGAAPAGGPGYGVGFVLTAADPFVCVDIDGALQADGKWSPLALKLCQSLPGCVVEVSHSGRGLHIWGRCTSLPKHSSKRTDLHIEMYSQRRFIAIGRDAIGTIAEECPAIAAVAAEYFPPRADATGAELPAEGPVPEWRGPADDADIIRRALASRSAASVFNGNRATFADLWTANAEALGRAYPSSKGDAFDRSSADAALASHLAFWTGKDTARIERLMRQSALVREKWDQRDDYLVARTIGGACRMQRDVLKDREAEPAPTVPTLAGGAATAGSPHKGVFLLACTPLDTARKFTLRDFNGDALKHWQGSFYRWRAGAWQEATPDDMRARLYGFIEDQQLADFKPNQTRVSNAMDALKAHTHMDSTITPPAWLDDRTGPAPGELVACANGLLHLPTRTLAPATPKLFNLNAVPFAYDARAAVPAQWLAFLTQVWPDDPQAVDTLQELFGYLLTPETSQQKVFLIVGPKRSGKGTIARVLTAMLGAANVASPTLASLGDQFGLQPLVGKLAAVVSDARLGGKADPAAVAEQILRISGEDQVNVGRKFLGALSLRLGVRFLLMTNELPRIADTSGALASRFVILTMAQSFYGREDPGLTSRLLNELPGVLAWAVEGWHRLTARGYFMPPASSVAAAQELADLGSPVGTFVREACVVGAAHDVGVDHLYLIWRMWCTEQGIERAGNKQQFGRDIGAVVPGLAITQPRVEGARVRAYRGVGLALGTRWHAGQRIAPHTFP